MNNNLVRFATPEVRLVLSLARTQLNLLDIVRAHKLLGENIAWDFVFRFARDNRVANLVYSNLNQHMAFAVPAPTIENFKRHYHSTLIKNLSLSKELYLLLDAFAAQALKVIPYKGTLLALEIFRNIGAREFQDLDLIVKKEDLQLAETILSDNGYVRVWPQPEISAARLQRHARQKYNYRYCHTNKQVMLELHWNVLPEYFSSSDEKNWFWKNTRSKILNGHPLQDFNSETYLIILCAHGANHCWLYHLSMVCDVAEFIASHPDLNWVSIFQTARSAGLYRVLCLGLWLAYQLLDTQFPPEVMEHIYQNPPIEHLGGLAAQHLLTQAAPTGFYIPRFQVALCESASARIRYLTQLLEPSEKDHKLVSLPSGFDWLYYLIRPFRLIRDHIGIPRN